jgi:hypothetical protein
MSDLVDMPDVFGHAVFCDDIRFEVDGKITYVGAYNHGRMNIRGSFPANLAKFCVGITFVQRRDIFVPNIALKIFLPTDPEDKPTVDMDLTPPAEIPDTGLPNVIMNANLIMAPCVINGPGDIRVRILRDGLIHRLGALRVDQEPQPAQPAST